MGITNTQPMQPLGMDEHGTMRFKENAVVQYLLNNGGLDMNDLAVQYFPQEDREQFAQLIGYSLGGFAELGYVRDETYATASAMSESEESEEQCRIKALQETLDEARKCIREAAVAVFQVHPDDLQA